MVRVHVRLTDEQARALKTIAAERGVSMSDLIRQSVAWTLNEATRSEQWQRALTVMGRYRSDRVDVSAEHDTYLFEE
jgi:Arc/MetJ-type ribon-helix-helix transcriptional regulator